MSEKGATVQMGILERIDRLRALLSGNVALGDAAHLWVEAELIAAEIERGSQATQGELKAAQELRSGISALVAQLREGGLSQSDDVSTCLGYLRSESKAAHSARTDSADERIATGRFKES
jgi:hypothetical protein